MGAGRPAPPHPFQAAPTPTRTRNSSQRAQITKGGQRDLLPDDKTDVRTGCSLCAQLEKLAQCIHGEMVTSVPEQAAAQACLFQDGVRIGPKLTEHARNNRRDAHVEEAALGWTWCEMRGGGGGLHGIDPILASAGLTWIDPCRQRASLEQSRVVHKGFCLKSHKALCGQCALRRRPAFLRSWTRLLDLVAKAPLRLTQSRAAVCSEEADAT